MHPATLLFLVVAAVSSFSEPSLAGLPVVDRDEILLFSTGGDDGGMTDFFVSASSAKTVPAWNPESGEPPLSVSQAAAKAMVLFRATHPNRRDVVIEGITLEPIVSSDLSDKWFFVFRFSPERDAGCSSKPQAPIVIFMDGTAATSRPSAER